MKKNNTNSNNYYLNKYKKDLDDSKNKNKKNILSYNSIYTNKQKNSISNSKPFEKLEEKEQNKNNVSDTQSNNLTILSKKKLSAMFLLLIGVNKATDIVKYFDEKELLSIGSEILNIKSISKEEYALVEKHFGKLNVENYTSISGDKEFIRELFQKAFGIAKGSNYFLRCIEETEKNKFGFLESLSKEDLFSVLKNESDVVISLILSLIPPKKSAEILPFFSSDRLPVIVKLMANNSELNTEVINTILDKIKDKVNNLHNNDEIKISGKEKLAEILKYTNPSDANNIIEELEDYNKELAEEIKEKIFTFNDILTIPKSEFEKILKIYNDSEIAFLLKGATEQIKEFFLSCVTKRRRRNILDEISFLGQVKKKDVEEKRKEFVKYLKHLESLGKVILSYNEEDFI